MHLNNQVAGTEEIYQRQFAIQTRSFKPQTQSVDIWDKDKWVKDQDVEAFFVYDSRKNLVYGYTKIGGLIQNEKDEAQQPQAQQPQASNTEPKAPGPSLKGALSNRKFAWGEHYQDSSRNTGQEKEQKQQKQKHQQTKQEQEHGLEKGAKTSGAETPADQTGAGTPGPEKGAKTTKAETQGEQKGQPKPTKGEQKGQPKPGPKKMGKDTALEIVDALIDRNVKITRIQNNMKKIFGEDLFHEIEQLHNANETGGEQNGKRRFGENTGEQVSRYFDKSQSTERTTIIDDNSSCYYWQFISMKLNETR